MTESSTAWRVRYQAFWQAEGRELAVAQLRTTCAFILICQVVFVGLDWWAFPEQFQFFLAMRLTVDAAVLLVLFKARFRWPEVSQLGVCIAVSAEILAMVYASGRADTPYFAGLILVLVGMPVLQPISVRGSLIVSAFTVLGYFGSVAAAPAPFEQRAFVIQTIFILSAALESAMSCALMSKNRVVGFEQRREIEAARDLLATLDEAKDRFASNVHHELRTPLTLMLAPLDTLRSGDLGELPEPVMRTLRTMHVNGRRLLKLINNLLDLAKLESDRFSINRSRQDLARVVELILEGATPMAERKGVSLSLDSDPTAPTVCADGDAIEKVVVNLVGNALKFTDAGGSVTARVEANPNGDGVLVSVVDTGIGLAPDDVNRVFDRFAQVDGSATREHEGTGIGLALAKELVEAHGGRIWAESPGLGLGSTMRFAIPVGEPDEDAAIESALAEDSIDLCRVAEASETGAPDSESVIALDLERTIERWESRHSLSNTGDEDTDASVSAPTIVVADDNAEMRELLTFLLGREFQVHLARNGLEALELVERLTPDLVVTDVMMPEMTGTELCAAIKSDPALQGVPVMLVSSKAEDDMKVRGLEIGADDYVTKPFHPRELLARARGLVRIRVLQREVQERNTDLVQALADLKEAESQIIAAERLAAVGELAAGIAHEVNNPVNFALNAVRALRIEIATISDVVRKVASATSAASGDPEAQREFLREQLSRLDSDDMGGTIEELGAIIAEGLERTRRLVGDLRDFASPNSAQRVDIDVAEAVRSTVNLLTPTAREAGVELVVRAADGLSHVHADRSSIDQVLMNLIKNAIDAALPGGSQVSVEARQVAGGAVELVVSDDGVGLANVDKSRIFDPFYTTKDAGVGTGLGLSICKKIAVDHGGSLAVRDSLGPGATFVLTLPTVKSAG